VVPERATPAMNTGGPARGENAFGIDSLSGATPAWSCLNEGA
jgi:hypothetical protein